MPQWIDLSYPIDETTPVYPGDPLFRMVTEADYESDGYRLSSVTVGTHLGTHIDAPLHFFADGESLDRIDLETFCGEAVVCDLEAPLCDQEKNSSSPTPAPARITVDMLIPYMLLLEHTPTVIFRTGWSRHWRHRDYFTHFPSILPETAEWLADFPIRLLGLDTPSLSAYGGALFADDPSSTDAWGGELCEALLHSDAESHRILLGRRPPMLILENLTSLDKIPAGEIFRLFCFPLPVRETDAFPARAVAQMEGDGNY